MIVTMDQLSTTAAYHVMTQTIIPRPIAWVLTHNVGVDNYNLAPFSYFTAVSSNPPLLMFSVAPKDETGQLKDSAVNILKNREFTVHIASQTQLQAVQDSAKPLPYGESEVDACQHTLVEFSGFSVPRLADCPIAFACRLYEHQSIGAAPQTLIFAEIVQIYIADDVVEGIPPRLAVDAKKVDPLGRLGLGQFADIDHIRRAKS